MFTDCVDVLLWSGSHLKGNTHRLSRSFDSKRQKVERIKHCRDDEMNLTTMCWQHSATMINANFNPVLSTKWVAILYGFELQWKFFLVRELVSLCPVSISSSESPQNAIFHSYYNKKLYIKNYIKKRFWIYIFVSFNFSLATILSTFC